MSAMNLLAARPAKSTKSVKSRKNVTPMAILRLNYNAPPAAFIEPERHVVGNRMPCTDIDIGSSGLPRESKREMIVLEIL